MESLVGKSILDLAWKDDTHPRSFRFMIYVEDLPNDVRTIIQILQEFEAYNVDLSFNCIKRSSVIKLESIFCLEKWPFHLTPEVLKYIMNALGKDKIEIVWPEDEDYGVSLDGSLVITDFWYPDGGG